MCLTIKFVLVASLFVASVFASPLNNPQKDKEPEMLGLEEAKKMDKEPEMLGLEEAKKMDIEPQMLGQEHAKEMDDEQGKAQQQRQSFPSFQFPHFPQFGQFPGFSNIFQGFGQGAHGHRMNNQEMTDNPQKDKEPQMLGLEEAKKMDDGQERAQQQGQSSPSFSQHFTNVLPQQFPNVLPQQFTHFFGSFPIFHFGQGAQGHRMNNQKMNDETMRSSDGKIDELQQSQQQLSLSPSSFNHMMQMIQTGQWDKLPQNHHWIIMVGTNGQGNNGQGKNGQSMNVQEIKGNGNGEMIENPQITRLESENKKPLGDMSEKPMARPYWE